VHAQAAAEAEARRRHDELAALEARQLEVSRQEQAQARRQAEWDEESSRHAAAESAARRRAAEAVAAAAALARESEARAQAAEAGLAAARAAAERAEAGAARVVEALVGLEARQEEAAREMAVAAAAAAAAAAAEVAAEAAVKAAAATVAAKAEVTSPRPDGPRATPASAAASTSASMSTSGLAVRLTPGRSAQLRRLLFTRQRKQGRRRSRPPTPGQLPEGPDAGPGTTLSGGRSPPSAESEASPGPAPTPTPVSVQSPTQQPSPSPGPYHLEIFHDAENCQVSPTTNGSHLYDSVVATVLRAVGADTDTDTVNSPGASSSPPASMASSTRAVCDVHWRFVLPAFGGAGSAASLKTMLQGRVLAVRSEPFPCPLQRVHSFIALLPFSCM